MDRRRVLSALWLFVVLNYLYCDVVSLMDSGLLRQYLTGTVNGLHLTPVALLGASALVEVSIAMVLLSRILPQRSNRWANVVAGAFTTVVQAATLLVGSPALYYIFFSVIEIASTIAILLLALGWKESKRLPEADAS